MTNEQKGKELIKKYELQIYESELTKKFYNRQILIGKLLPAEDEAMKNAIKMLDIKIKGSTEFIKFIKEQKKD